MLFTTSHDRALYFQDLEDGDIPFEGAAMHHARGTNIGIWGDRGLLKRDCARVLAAEMRREYDANSFGLHPPPVIAIDEIMHSTVFTAAFDHARCVWENEIEHQVASLSDAPVMITQPPATPTMPDTEVARATLAECQSRTVAVRW